MTFWNGPATAACPCSVGGLVASEEAGAMVLKQVSNSNVLQGAWISAPFITLAVCNNILSLLKPGSSLASLIFPADCNMGTTVLTISRADTSLEIPITSTFFSHAALNSA